MSQLTIISRISDNLILTEAFDQNENKEARDQALGILKQIDRKSPNRMTIDAENRYFAYILDEEYDIVLLAFFPRNFSKKLAFKFLEELQKEFTIQYGPEIKSAKRPYAFVKFDTFIRKTKKTYEDSSIQRNLERVTEDLTDVHQTMSKSIHDILVRGEKITSVTQKSEELYAQSELYEKQAKQLNMNMFLRKYGPVISALLLVIGYLYFFLL